MKINFLKISIFIMIFTSSLVSVQLGDISLNKIGIIPFYLVVMFKEINNKKKTINKKTNIYILFLICTIFSSILAILFPIRNVEGMISAQINYIIQVVIIYIPIIYWISTSNIRDEYTKNFFNILVKIIRFHAIFIILQFFIYNLFNINISSLIFDGLFHGITGNNWTSHVYGTDIVIRASGLNFDPAFASYLMICGFIFDNKKIYKVLYMICTILAQSRTGFICILLILIISLFQKKKNKINKKTILQIFYVIIIVLIILFIILKNEYLIKQFNSIFERISDIFSDIQTQDISSARHSSYPVLALKYLSDFNFLKYYIFGVGPRAGGLALIEYSTRHYVDFELVSTMYTKIWAIECDFAEILLGCGILGFILYYLQILKFILNKNNKIKYFGFAILSISFMYDFCFTTINVLMFIFTIMLSINLKEKKDKYDEQSSNNTNKL